jgi:hypothetical protein
MILVPRELMVIPQQSLNTTEARLGRPPQQGRQCIIGSLRITLIETLQHHQSRFKPSLRLLAHIVLRGCLNPLAGFEISMGVFIPLASAIA